MATYFKPIPRTELDEDGFPSDFYGPVPLEGKDADKAVQDLADGILTLNLTTEQALALEGDDWDGICELAKLEEYTGLVTPAIASRVCCLLLQSDIENRQQDEAAIPARIPPQSETAPLQQAVCPTCRSAAIETRPHDEDTACCQRCGDSFDAKSVLWVPLEVPEPLPALQGWRVAKGEQFCMYHQSHTGAHQFLTARQDFVQFSGRCQAKAPAPARKQARRAAAVSNLTKEVA